MTDLQKLQKRNDDLVKALKDANNLINKYVPEGVADSPQVWNIVSVLERNGVKANSIVDKSLNTGRKSFINERNYFGSQR